MSDFHESHLTAGWFHRIYMAYLFAARNLDSVSSGKHDFFVETSGFKTFNVSKREMKRCGIEPVTSRMQNERAAIGPRRHHIHRGAKDVMYLPNCRKNFSIWFLQKNIWDSGYQTSSSVAKFANHSQKCLEVCLPWNTNARREFCDWTKNMLISWSSKENS